jgi:glutamate-ammonia-ligase adenylyltransferase
MVETHARHRIHENAARVDPVDLKTATKHVRERLEREKSSRGRRDGIDIKYGKGGMLDVYFAVRYLQLRNEVPDEGEDRSTTYTLERLNQEEAISDDDYAVLSYGYSLLRAVDHSLRLIVGRSTRLPESDHPTASDVATRMGFESAAALQTTLVEQMSLIREAYQRVVD